jgi:ribosomal protein S27AE
MNDLPIIDGRRPCPDCGVLSEYTRDRNWECPACHLVWQDNDPPLPPLPDGNLPCYGDGI